MNRILWIVLFFMIISLQGCYVIKQGIGQFNLRINQTDITEAIKKEQNEEFRHLLLAVPQIKQYAEEKIQLKASQNYSGYYSTKDEGIAFVVTAASKTELVPYTWWFPIIGSVPYKGFFNKEDAIELEDDLSSDGLDTWLFAAPAYSTLGWFKDPITTPMLKKGQFYLASTIIHEMVHSTLYVNGQGDFNEQLASFVGYQGALQYFTETRVLSNQEISGIIENKEKQKKFTTLIKKYVSTLEQLYASASEKEEILKKREEVFTRLKEEILILYPNAQTSFLTFNNARILQYKRYDSDSKILQDYWEESHYDWPVFWEYVRQFVKSQGWSSG